MLQLWPRDFVLGGCRPPLQLREELALLGQEHGLALVGQDHGLLRLRLRLRRRLTLLLSHLHSCQPSDLKRFQHVVATRGQLRRLRRLQRGLLRLPVLRHALPRRHERRGHGERGRRQHRSRRRRRAEVARAEVVVEGLLHHPPLHRRHVLQRREPPEPRDLRLHVPPQPPVQRECRRRRGRDRRRGRLPRRGLLQELEELEDLQLLEHVLGAPRR
mmetsp:Transcript_6369/g.14828  ORF Transcript_6369/g.14828 Transcript_6369/m.14828 type:complete len:216 (+) Transcript_6369:209-856(+)